MGALLQARGNPRGAAVLRAGRHGSREPHVPLQPGRLPGIVPAVAVKSAKERQNPGQDPSPDGPLHACLPEIRHAVSPSPLVAALESDGSIEEVECEF